MNQNMYQSVTGKSKEDILNEVSSMNWGSFKVSIHTYIHTYCIIFAPLLDLLFAQPLLADAVVDHIAPIQKR